LDDGGDAQAAQADEQRSAASSVGFQGVVDLIAGVMGVTAHCFREGVTQSPAQSTCVVVVVMPTPTSTPVVVAWRGEWVLVSH
jgi:hypothetical protein